MTREQTEKLIEALTRLAYGTASGPTGLEALSMAIAGNGLYKPLSEAVDNVADSLQNISDNLDTLIT